MIKLQHVSKAYDNSVVYDNFNLDIEGGKIFTLLGESGSGKTTLLNIIAKLVDFSGTIDGVDYPLSFIFQNDRLVKTMTTEQNIRLVAKDADVKHYFEKFGLKGCENKYPKELSAGMARRVSILRAFLFDSNVILMDEPFINLDIKVKYALMDEIKFLQKQMSKTVVFVTHDIDEALYLSDRIAILNRGNIVYDKQNSVDKKEILKGEILSQFLK